MVEVKAGNFYVRAVVGAEPLTIETGEFEARGRGARHLAQRHRAERDRNPYQSRRARGRAGPAGQAPARFFTSGTATNSAIFGEVLSITPTGRAGRARRLHSAWLARECLLGRGSKCGRETAAMSSNLPKSCAKPSTWMARGWWRWTILQACGRLWMEAYRGAPSDIAPVVLADVTPVPSRRGASRAQPSRTQQGGATRLGRAVRPNTWSCRPAPTSWCCAAGTTGWIPQRRHGRQPKSAARAAVPPRLEARRPDGTWQTVVADLGLPSGRSRFVLADLRDRLDSAWPERPESHAPLPLRIVTNLRVSWDEILAGRGGRKPAPDRAPGAGRGLALPGLLISDDFAHSQRSG